MIQDCYIKVNLWAVPTLRNLSKPSGNPGVRASATFNFQLSTKLMAQFWIVFFFILLAVAELYQSVKDIVLPLPVYLVLGAVLAVASNYQQQISFDRNQRVTLTEMVEPPSILAEAKPQLSIAAEDPDRVSAPEQAIDR
jgi:hypothetical protein